MKVTWTHWPTLSVASVAGDAPTKHSPVAACRPTHKVGCNIVTAPYQPAGSLLLPQAPDMPPTQVRIIARGICGLMDCIVPVVVFP